MWHFFLTPFFPPVDNEDKKQSRWHLVWRLFTKQTNKKIDDAPKVEEKFESEARAVEERRQSCVVFIDQVKSVGFKVVREREFLTALGRLLQTFFLKHSRKNVDQNLHEVNLITEALRCGTCCQEIAQFYLHAHALSTNRLNHTCNNCHPHLLNSEGWKAELA